VQGRRSAIRGVDARVTAALRAGRSSGSARDLRAFDHAALARALRDANQVFCTFIFDREILDRLPSAFDRRVEFIWKVPPNSMRRSAHGAEP
jgi:hypothetical protein